jgi:transcriptional regulator with XRE-family HTH domain
MGRGLVTTLAKTLSTLRESADISRRQLEEVSGVSEETLKKIEYDRNRRPSPETLRKIAIGLGTNRALGRVDQGAADEMYASLMAAAGYLPPPEAVTEPIAVATSIEAELEAMGYDPEEEAPLWAALTTELARRQGESRRKLLEMFRAMAEMSRD